MYRHLQRISEDRGARMDSPSSKSEIRKFLKLYKNQVSLDDIADPIDSFNTFNEFFYRKLKPGARPIAHESDGFILTSAADCRLMAFETVDESKRFWIKVRVLLSAEPLDCKTIG
jgi:phosphatidylserine decarboxylase